MTNPSEALTLPAHRRIAITIEWFSYATLKRVLGVTPVGYRAPGGENYDALLGYLRERGFLYSSSFRDDIRPYRHRLRDGSKGPVELPVNMSFELNDDFAQETGLVCGGQMDVYIEPIEPSPELYVIGAGHVGTE